MKLNRPGYVAPLALPQVAVHLVFQCQTLEPSLFLWSHHARPFMFIRHTFDSEQLEYKGLLRSKAQARRLILALGLYSYIGSYLFLKHLLGTGNKLIIDHGS